MTPAGVLLAAASAVSFFVNHEGVSVQGQSMEPTYRRGERLVVERIHADDIRRGDVVLIEIPGPYAGRPVLRRVIGTGGDHVVGDGTRILVNDEPLHEPYVVHDEVVPEVATYDVQVPEKRLFLLGDNRANSNDSRYSLDEQSGSVAASGVIGRVRDSSVIVATASAVVVGGLLTFVGIGLGAAGHVANRRSRSVQPPWAVAGGNR
ncbi:signal peptidase I [Streptomyces sp. NPDC051840]